MSDLLHIVCPRCAAVNRVPASRLDAAPSCGACHRALFDGHPTELTAETFHRHLQRNDLPVLIDFWAPWCGPCRTMAPAYEQATARLEPHVRLAKLNTELVPALSAEFEIRSIPTLALFRRGREIARQAGAMDASAIERWTAMQLG